MMLYLLKSSLLISFLYLVYFLVLKSNSTFKFNRFYLLFALVISITYPLINFSIDVPLTEGTLLAEGSQVVVNLTPDNILKPTRHTSNDIDLINTIVVFSYISITLLLLSRLLINLYRLLYSTPSQGNQLEGMQCIYHSKENGVYSFFNRLYLPSNNSIIKDSILRHEKAHYKQLHSLDILFIESYLILFWFNPFAWLIRRAIKSNHEYLADQYVVQQKDASTYLQDILSVLKVKNTPILGSNFSYLSIKNRIKMIQHSKKNPIKKYLSLSLSLLLGLGLLGIFSFKPKAIDKEISKQMNENLGIEIYKKPEGYPIFIEKIEKISSGFGMRINPINKTKKMHTGTDIVAAPGTQILATGNGKIIKAEYGEKFGFHIVIQHNEKYKSLYAHLKSISVKKGDEVKEGETIGIIGNSGLSMGTHLHYEIHEFDVKIDPQIKSTL